MRQKQELPGVTSDSIAAALSAVEDERRTAIRRIYNDAVDQRDFPLIQLIELVGEHGVDRVTMAWRVVTMLYGSRS